MREQSQSVLRLYQAVQIGIQPMKSSELPPRRSSTSHTFVIKEHAYPNAAEIALCGAWPSHASHCRTSNAEPQAGEGAHIAPERRGSSAPHRKLIPNKKLRERRAVRHIHVSPHMHAVLSFLLLQMPPKSHCAVYISSHTHLVGFSALAADPSPNHKPARGGTLHFSSVSHPSRMTADQLHGLVCEVAVGGL